MVVPVCSGDSRIREVIHMRYQFGFDYFRDAFLTVGSTMGTTLFITFVSFVSAFVLAIILALLSLSKNRGIHAFLRVYLSLFRGTPLLAQLFFFVYGLFPFIPVINKVGLTIQGVSCLALSFAAPMSETLRGAIQSVDKGQMEACLACGMTRGQGYVRIVFPQAFRLAIPALMNNFIECFKGSSLCSMVGITDMMLRAKMLVSRTLRYSEGYLAVLLLYWLLNMIFVTVQKELEHKLSAKY